MSQWTLESCRLRGVKTVLLGAKVYDERGRPVGEVAGVDVLPKVNVMMTSEGYTATFGFSLKIPKGGP